MGRQGWVGGGAGWRVECSGLEEGLGGMKWIGGGAGWNEVGWRRGWVE